MKDNQVENKEWLSNYLGYIQLNYPDIAKEATKVANQKAGSHELIGILAVVNQE